jgi:ADP-ribose pyrophosphatase YjhB (NUDIX family)
VIDSRTLEPTIHLDQPRHLGQLLALLRRQRGISQTTIALELGTASSANIHRFEKAGASLSHARIRQYVYLLAQPVIGGRVYRDALTPAQVETVAYLALTPTTEDPPEDRPARLFAIDELGTPDGPRFAYDHDRIVPDALERARSKLEYTALATAFVAEPFTLGELRHVYEAVWGVPLDAANFRRKVVSTRDFVVPIEGLAPPGPGGGRPAKRYRRGSAQRLHPAMLRPE